MGEWESEMNRADRFGIVLGRLVAARIAAGGAPDAINLQAYADLARRIIETAGKECPPPEREEKRGTPNG